MSPPTVSAGPLPQMSTARTDASAAILRATTSVSSPIRRSMALRASGLSRQIGRDAVGDRVVDGLQRGVGTEGVDPGGGVGELAQRGDAAVLIEPQHVGEFRVECPSRTAGNSSVVPGHQEVAVVEDPKLVGLCLHLEVLADLPPQVALHGLGTTVLAAHAQRKALGGMADEVLAQQRR